MKKFTIKDSKKLFFCLALITVTACGGGGGGGGGSSSPSDPQISDPPKVVIPNVNGENSGYHIEKEAEGNVAYSVSLKGEKVVGVYGKNVNFLKDLDITDEAINKNGESSLEGYSFGIFSENGSVINAGTITLKGDKIVGILGNNSDITNNNIIKSIVDKKNKIITNNVIGIFLSGENGIVRNNSEINLSSIQSSIGMYLYNSVGINNRDIIVSSEGTAIGIYAIGKNASGTNNGKITVKGNGYGMISGYGGRVTNLGEITVQDKGYGMYAFAGGYALNDKGGVINLSSQANGAMLADGNGSVVENRGVINIDKNNSIIKNDELKAINGGKIINNGVINKNGSLILSSNTGVYQIGTSQDGNYGKLKSENLKIDGNIEIDSNIAKGGYDEKYLLENVFEGDEISFGENTAIKSNSILYDASIKENAAGNMDGELVRNDKNISDFAGNNFGEVASIFDGYINSKDEYDKLTSEEKEVVDTIFDHTKSENSLKDAISQVSGTEYLNTQKQIFDIKNSFKEYDNSVISTLDTYKFNFKFIGEYSETDAKNGISGYESKMSGFDGAMKLSDNLYGVLGYGYSDIDYDGKSDGKIRTIHTGIYKDLFADGYKLRMGLYGEYNFHENNRSVFDKMAESKYNSYLAGVSGEISRRYGEDLYIEPSLSLDIAYGNIEKFDEEKAAGFNLAVDEQEYTSILPKAEVILGKDFENVKLFASAKYSYELGDMDKDLAVKWTEKANVKNNEMEHGQFEVSAGGSIKINNLSLDAKVGKEFGRRDREYVKAGFSYTF